jgi:hypothetical protein
MFRIAIRISALMLLTTMLWACGTPPTREAANANAGRPAQSAPRTGVSQPQGASPQGGGGLEFGSVPKEWTSQPVTSQMHLAKYEIPLAEGDTTPATFVVFNPIAGSVQDNIDRWVGFVQQPDGSQSKDKVKIEKIQANGLNITVLDLTGNFNGGEMGGGNIPNARMRNAVIESSRGNYFVRFVGPQKTVAKWDQAYIEFLKSARLK